MRTLLAHCLDTVMAVETSAGDAGVIKIRTEPAARGVTVAALRIGRNVTGGLADSLYAVVTDDAVALHRQRDLRMIDGLGRIPAHHGVACRTVLTGCRVGRALALRNRAVMAGDAA